MMKSWNASLGVLLVLACVTHAAGATGADVLRANRGARPSALGGAYGAVGGDPQVLLFNPAGLATVRASSIIVQHDLGMEEITDELLGYGQPVEDLGVLSGVLVWRHLPAIDNLGADDDPVSVNDVVVTLGISRPLVEIIQGLPGALSGLSVGGALKILSLSLGGVTAYGAGFDAGLYWDLAVGLQVPASLSAAVQNVGTPVRYEEEADPLPLAVRLAAAVTPVDSSQHRILLTGEVRLEPEQAPVVSAGLEYTLAKILSFRLGYTAEAPENLAGPAAGIGITFVVGALTGRVDYAYRPTLWDQWNSVANNHYLSFGAQF